MTQNPRRIVSLVPSATETICQLGARDLLLACTRYCTEPAGELATLPRIGGTKNPDLEAIARLDPELVLANGEENRREDIEWLSERVPTLVQTPCTIVEAANDLRVLAQRLERLEAVEPFLLRIEARIAEAEVAALGRQRPRVYYAIWRKPWMTINASTFIHDVLHCVGAHNVAADEEERYPSFTPQRAADMGVDVVLLASEPWEFDEPQRDEIESSRAFGDARVVLCDGRDFCWHGTRMADGLGRASSLLSAWLR